MPKPITQIQLRNVFSLFEQSVDTGIVPSAPNCNILCQILAKNKEYTMAFSVYKRMTVHGVLSTYLSLSALAECLVHFCIPQLAMAVIGLILKRGYSVHVYVVNLILNGFCCHGLVVKAEELLGEMGRNGVLRDRVSFNNLIKGYCRERKLSDAMSVKKRMECANVFPDLVTYNILLDSYFREGQVGEAVELWEEMRNLLEPGVISYSTLINRFCNSGDVDKASEIFDEMLSEGVLPDNVTYNCLILGLCRKGKLGKTKRLFNDDDITFTRMICGLCEVGKTEKAVELFDFMLEKGVEPSIVAYNTLINGLCKVGLLNDAFRILEMMTEKNMKPNVVTYNMILKGLCDVGKVDGALKLFNSMKSNKTHAEPDSSTGLDSRFMYLQCYNRWIMQVRLNQRGKRESSLEQAGTLFKDLVSGNCQPDVISYNIIIQSTIKAGDVEFSNELLIDMQRRGLKPDAWTFSILINRFSKLGMTEEAKSIYDQMRACGFSPNVCVFDSLLKRFSFSAVGKSEEILELLHQIADSGVVLDDELSSTILMCICGIPEAENIVKLLPSFTQDVSNSKRSSLVHDKLLTKLHNSAHKRQTYPP